MEGRKMSSRITLLATAVATLLAAAAANAQSATTNAIAAGAEPESTACTYIFGSGNLKWCVNEHGNLMQFESPAGQEHIRVGGYQEGYVVCVNGDAATYYDNGLTEAGWFAPVLVAKTTSSVTIDRTTSDGRFKLTQKWSRDTTERDLTVQMTLLNLGPAVNVKLARNADIDANNDFVDDRYDASRYGAWVRDIDGVAMYGLTLSPAPTAVIESVSVPTAKCNPVPAAVPGGPGDPGAYVIYDFGALKTNAKKIVKVGYRAQ
jgi:hypothetical protein